MITPRTLDEYRQDIMTAVAAAAATFTAYPLVIEYDNRITMDTQVQNNPYLCVELQYSDAKQADLSANPFHRVTGFLILTAKDKEGAGTARAYKLLEHFYPKLHKRKLGTVNAEMADLDKPRPLNGWVGISALIPIWFSKTY